MNSCDFDGANDQLPATLRLQENKTCVTNQIGEQQAWSLREHFGRYVTVRPAWEWSAWEITAKQYVGIIATGDLRILIEPKVSLQNLFYMLTYAYELPDFRRESAELATGDDLFEFIVVIFLRQVERLVRQGIYRTYITHEEDDPFLRGRLLLAEHLQRNAVRVQHFYQRTEEFTPDVLENQVLKHTLWLLSRVEYSQPALRQQIRRVASAFVEVSPVFIAPSDCDRILYTRLNLAYRSRINLARLLMQHLSLEGQTGSTQFAAYLFDMSKVFELFVARFLENRFVDHPAIQVDIQQDIWLDADQKEVGIPDIVLRWDGRPYLVLDTKYKVFEEKPKGADRNQMLVYCHTLDLCRGSLIYANDQPIDYRARFKGVTLNVQALPLHGSLDEFQDRCRYFADYFAQTVSAERTGSAASGSLPVRT
jgi:5-methylcytosine-specific restriction enzyme subunit McrC